MKYYIIAGERSGDLHASNLILELQQLDTDAVFKGLGGDYMKSAGCALTAHYDQVAVMGFLEVFFGFRKVLKYLRLVKMDILAFKPDALILVDFGGFNMKMAKYANKHGVKVHYYIVPKVWAWNQKRAYTLKKYVDSLYSILPFEPVFFKKFDWDVQYVGNPLLDEIKKFQPNSEFLSKNKLGDKPIVALLPGSRRQEVNYMLGTMIGIVGKFTEVEFVVAGVNNLPKEVYQKASFLGLKIIFDQTYDLLQHAKAAIVTSGTATLEAAIFQVPQVVVYKTSSISYNIAKHLIRVPYISLVNLIANKEVVRELIQDQYNEQKVLLELKSILETGEYRQRIKEEYHQILKKIGNKKASKETAKLIFESL